MAYLSLIICIVGLIVYLVADRAPAIANLGEIGRIMFFAGLLALLFGH